MKVMDKVQANLMVGGKTNLVATALLRANKAWADLFERDKLRAGDELAVYGMRPGLVYFPVDGLVSILVCSSAEDPGRVQSAMCGAEDVVSVLGLVGDAVAKYRAVVDLDTPAWRVSAQAARRVLDDCPRSRAIVARVVDQSLTESWLSLASNSEHSVFQRLCAFLVRSAAVAGDRTLPFSQPFIADRLGVRRPTVSEQLKDMDDEGVIRRERARLHLLKMDELRAAAAPVLKVLETHRRAYREAIENA